MRLTLRLAPSADQKTKMRRLLAELQSPRSALYRYWLTPEEYADRFGVSSADISQIEKWLRANGLQVAGVARSRRFLIFSGAASQVEHAFGVEIHRFERSGEAHFASVKNPAMPAALADVVAGLKGLDDFRPRPLSIERPQNTLGSGHTLAPDDFATIYDVTPLYQAGIDGSGQTVAVVGDTAIDLTDMKKFRTRYNLPGADPVVTLVPFMGDPGTSSSDLIEAALDLEWVQAVARNASVQYVYSVDPSNAIQYVIDQNLATVISSSYGWGCEAQDPGDAEWFEEMAQQAAVQGITWVNASGDAGAGDCDGDGAPVAQDGKSVDLPGSVPEVVAVGGTQFDDSAGSYWAASNTASGASALSYIPERVWNSVPVQSALWAGGGGTSISFAKPAWQVGPGVPDDGARDVPDVSLAASPYSGYLIISGGRQHIVGGTSAGAPAFAGIVALLNQYLMKTGAIMQPGLGNINPGLYAAATANPSAFHDIAAGDNRVNCVAGSPDCVSGSFGYTAGVGYDAASGLGSPDVNNLVKGWTSSSPSGSMPALSVDANPVYQRKTLYGNPWVSFLTVTEEGGVATTITDFQIDGMSYASQIPAMFGSATLPAFGSLTANVSTSGLTTPHTRVFTVSGADAGGRKWTRTLSVRYLGLAPKPTVSAAANGASFEQAFAPGMVLSLFGSNLATGTQVAGVLPLTSWLSGALVTANNQPAPLYYVSPGQVNLQIPYETPPGPTILTVYSGEFTGSFEIQVRATAPGIFTAANGEPVPDAGGYPGREVALFITGAGAVTPALSTGDAPYALPLPAPIAPVTVSIGGASAPVRFAGNPWGLVGVTQINLNVPAVPAGPQPLVVKVGDNQSQTARFTVTSCSGSCIQ